MAAPANDLTPGTYQPHNTQLHIPTDGTPATYLHQVLHLPDNSQGEQQTEPASLSCTSATPQLHTPATHQLARIRTRLPSCQTTVGVSQHISTVSATTQPQHSYATASHTSHPPASTHPHQVIYEPDNSQGDQQVEPQRQPHSHASTQRDWLQYLITRKEGTTSAQYRIRKVSR